MQLSSDCDYHMLLMCICTCRSMRGTIGPSEMRAPYHAMLISTQAQQQLFLPSLIPTSMY